MSVIPPPPHTHTSCSNDDGKSAHKYERDGAELKRTNGILQKKVKEILKKSELIRKIYDYAWYLRRSRYFPKLRRVINPQTSIIANSCFGGIMVHDLGFTYNSPTVGLYFVYPDYIRFLSRLREYLNAPLRFKEKSKYVYCQKRHAATPWNHPIGVLSLDDEEIEIQFLHYHSEKEALEKWTRRKSRINFDDIIVMGFDQHLCTKQDIEAFLKLPFKKKYFFSGNPYFETSQSSEFQYDKKFRWNGGETIFHKTPLIYKHIHQS